MPRSYYYILKKQKKNSLWNEILSEKGKISSINDWQDCLRYGIDEIMLNLAVTVQKECWSMCPGKLRIKLARTFICLVGELNEGKTTKTTNEEAVKDILNNMSKISVHRLCKNNYPKRNFTSFAEQMIQKGNFVMKITSWPWIFLWYLIPLTLSLVFFPFWEYFDDDRAAAGFYFCISSTLSLYLVSEGEKKGYAYTGAVIGLILGSVIFVLFSVLFFANSADIYGIHLALLFGLMFFISLPACLYRDYWFRNMNREYESLLPWRC